ncbi:BTB/POZ protein [Halteromyces radiatus]|uniref:BTB/POZ protein n=1 Tax=Halteromyces radiatus TaxID=101107 RepID=UPI00221EBBF2|nr:BTB/POZ protein [Halteromyces radiatus]KAI8092664.1 BTB/POZ protein [Halteromyces radiatus]
MTTTGASFFDSFIPPTKESIPPFQHHNMSSQESTTTSPTSALFDYSHHDDPQQESFPDTPVPTLKELKTITHFSVYEEYLPEWQMLSESYKSQKQELHQRITQQLHSLQELEDRFEKMSMDFHRKVESAYKNLSQELVEWQDELELEKKSSDREKEMMRHVRKAQEEKIKLNVGGQLFETSLSTLRRDPNSTLAAMFNGHSNITPDETDGSYFIDRDSTYFRLVLNYLRDLRVPSSIREDPKVMDELMQEARHYQINGLLKLGMTEDTTRLFLY